jgi:hypothetical protein
MTVSVRSAAVSPLYDPGGMPREDQLAAIAFPGEVQRSNTRGLPARPQVLLPVGSRPRPRGPRRNQGSHRDVPRDDGTTRPCAIDDRSAPVDSVRLLPLRPHRRSDPRQSRPVRAPPKGPTNRTTRNGPRRARPVPVHRRAHAPLTAGSDQSANERVSASSTHTCCAPPSSWPHSTPAYRSATSNSPPATPTPVPQSSTTIDVRTSTATPRTSSLPSSPAAEQHDADRHFDDVCGDVPPHVSGRTISASRRDRRRTPGPARLGQVPATARGVSTTVWPAVIKVPQWSCSR